MHIAGQPKIYVCRQGVYIVQPTYFSLARSMAPGKQGLPAALGCGKGRIRVCRSARLRRHRVPLSLICRRWAAPVSLGTETPELVNGGREPEKEVVEGARGLLLVSVHLSKHNYPGDQVFG